MIDYILSENVQYINNYYTNDIVANTIYNNFDIVQIVSGVPKVRQSVCYIMESGEVLVGVLSEPLFSLSDRLNLLIDIEQTVSKVTGNKAYVTLDTDLFVGISKCKDNTKAEEIKDLIIMRNNARM